MEQRYLRGFSTEEKTELWNRWQRGESLKAIGRAFGKPSSSIYFQLAPHGGILDVHRERSGFCPAGKCRVNQLQSNKTGRRHQRTANSLGCIL